MVRMTFFKICKNIMGMTICQFCKKNLTQHFAKKIWTDNLQKTICKISTLTNDLERQFAGLIPTENLQIANDDHHIVI